MLSFRNRTRVITNISTLSRRKTSLISTFWNVDHSFTANSRLSVRGLWTRGDYISPPALPGFLQDSKTSPTNVSISHTQVFNPTTINEARAYMQREFGSGIQVQSTTISASDLGFRNNPVPPSTAVPGIDVDNFFSLGNSGSGTTYNLSQKWGYEDNVTLVRGRHTLKFGGSFRTARYAEWGEWGTRGDFEFTGSVPGSALGDFLIGAPASYLQRNNLNMSISRYTLIGFAQDDLKVTPRLTLNLGFRWDVNANPKEKHGQIAFWMPETILFQYAIHAVPEYASRAALHGRSRGARPSRQQ